MLKSKSCSELLKLEQDRTNEELNSTKAVLNSWKAAVSNEVRVYQQFVDRNLALKKREDELQLNVNELEAKEAELQRIRLIEPQSKLYENNAYNNNLNLENKQEEVIPINDIFIPPSNMVIDYLQYENETFHHPSKVEPSSGALIFDTKDLYLRKAQT